MYLVISVAGGTYRFQGRGGYLSILVGLGVLSNFEGWWYFAIFDWLGVLGNFGVWGYLTISGPLGT